MFTKNPLTSMVVNNSYVPAENPNRLPLKTVPLQKALAVAHAAYRINGCTYIKHTQRFSEDENKKNHVYVKNLETEAVVRVIEEIPRSFATVMATYNVLSVTSFTDFLKDMLTIKQKYATLSRTLPLSIDVPYVRYPPFLAGWIITENFIKDMEDSVTFMYRNRNWGPVFDGFYDFEVNRMERLYYVMRENMGEKESNFEQRRNFYEFIQEYDKRRGTDFFKTFPELKGFYYYCKDR